MLLLLHLMFWMSKEQLGAKAGSPVPLRSGTGAPVASFLEEGGSGFGYLQAGLLPCMPYWGCL